MEKKPNYSEYVLHPTNDVLVNPNILIELQKFVNRVRGEHTKFNFTQQVTWFHKETHKPVDSSKKISQEKLQSDYYQNINLPATEKKGRVELDEISLSAIRLQAAFEEIFRYNIDKGNAVPRSPVEETEQVQSAPETEDQNQETNES